MGQEQMQEVTILYTYVHILKAYIRLFICFALGTWKYMKYLLGLHLRLFIEPQQGLLFVQMYDGNSMEDDAGRMEAKYFPFYGGVIFTGLFQYFTL